MVCIGGFCFADWQVLLVVGVVLRAFFDWFLSIPVIRQVMERMFGKVFADGDVQGGDPNGIEVVDEERFAEIVKETEGVTFAMFSATWCGPCKSAIIKFAGHKEKNDNRDSYVKVDVDESRDLAETFAIRVLPTFVALARDETRDPKWQVKGTLAGPVGLAEFISQHRSSAVEKVKSE